MAITELMIKQTDGSYNSSDTGPVPEYIELNNNTTLADKIASWNGKQDAVQGKGLSTNDYTNTEKSKLAGISGNADVNIIESISVNNTPVTPDVQGNVNIEVVDPENLAPEMHASSTTIYGVATRENYGHAKFGTTAGTAIQANDDRLSNSRTPISHASSSTGYGTASATLYGHAKVVDAVSSDNNDTAAAASAHSVYQGLLGKCDNLDYDSETLELSLKAGNTLLKKEVIKYSPKTELVVTIDDDKLNGQTITCSISGEESETLTETVPSTGFVTFGLSYIGTYTISCGGYSTTVTNVSEGDALNITLHVAKTTVTLTTSSQEWYSSTAVVSKNNVQVGTIQLVNGTGTIKLYETGTYVFTLEGKSDSLTISSLDTAENITINNLELVSWSTGTDEQIKAMIDAYYDGSITLSDVKSVWSVGDVRKIHLNSMNKPNPNSSTTLAAQDIQIVILDFDHTELATPINGKTKALITVQTKEIIGPGGSWNGQDGSIYVNGDSSYDMSFTKWSNLYMRTYLNNTVLAAIPSGDFKTAIKQSKHNRLTTNGSSSKTTESVTDTLFLPSYPEVFGNVAWSYYLKKATPASEEGTQFKYFETQSNRIKYGNNNGSPNSTACYWWEGSPSSYYNSSYGYNWCFVSTGGSATDANGTVAIGLAPAFVM